jgi:hypothetical protein
MTYQIVTETVDFIQRREILRRQAGGEGPARPLALKREIRLPVLAETREAILELEDQIHSLKLECLRTPQLLMLPDMLETTPTATRHPCVGIT